MTSSHQVGIGLDCNLYVPMKEGGGGERELECVLIGLRGQYVVGVGEAGEEGGIVNRFSSGGGGIEKEGGS